MKNNCFFLLLGILISTALQVNAQSQADKLDSLAQIYYENEQNDSARWYWQQSANLYQKHAQWPNYLSIQNKIGISLANEQSYAQALKVFQEARDISEEKLENELIPLADNYLQSGKAYQNQEKYDAAIVNYQKALQKYTQQFGELHPQVALCYNLMGTSYRVADQLNKAIEAHQKAITILNELPEDVEEDLAQNYINLGTAFYDLGDFEEAQNSFEKAKVTLEKKFDVNDPRFGNISYLTGNLWLYKGFTSKAIGNYQVALEIFKGFLGEKVLEVGIVYNNLAIAYKNLGAYEEALNYYQNALDIFINNLGAESSYVAGIYSNLSTIYSARGNVDRALELDNKALQIYIKPFGEKSEAVATSYHNIANDYLILENYAKALEYLQKSIKIEEEIYPPNHPALAVSFQNLGEIYGAQKKFSEAQAAFEKALRISQENYGDKHPEIAYTYNDLAKLAFAQKNYQQAQAYAQQALVANLKAYHQQDPYQLPSVEDYFSSQHLFESFILQVEIAEQLQRDDDRSLKLAYEYLLLADLLIDQTRGKVKTQEDKLFLSKQVSQLTEKGIEICKELYEVKNQILYLQKAFYFSQKSKAHVLLEALSEANARQFGGIPDTLLEQERDLKDNIIFYEKELALTEDSTHLVLYRQKLFDFNQAYQNLITRLEKEYPKYYALKYQIKTVSVPELQRVLNKQTALIDYFTGDSLVHIFTISKDRYTLESRPVTSKVKRYARGLRNGLIFKQASTFRNSARELYKMLFPQKISSAITQIVFLPDGLLSTIPFETLLSKEIEASDVDNYAAFPYLIKDYQISYDYSPVLFYENVQAKNKVQAPRDLIAFAPVFAKNKQIGVDLNNLNLLAEFDQMDSSNTRGILDNRQAIAEIPGTETEIEAIYDIFTKQKQIAQIYTRDKAHEEQVKLAALNQYKYIHFATHGFVNSDAPKLSGILMMYDSTLTEDGVLFMGEIYNLDLNAELVTLSACETGLGRVVKGEGIIGLTQAFIYAGAKNVLVSLWKVSDASTTELMIDFYESLLKEKKRSLVQSIQEAKLKMIREETYANPYFWAPFILIGK